MNRVSVLALCLASCSAQERGAARTYLVREPEGSLERGFGVAISEEDEVGGQRMGKTGQGRWIAMSHLDEAIAMPGLSRDAVSGRLDVAWVADRSAGVWAHPETSGAFLRSHAAFETLRVAMEPAPPGWTRTQDGYMKTEQLRIAHLAERPQEVGPAEVWIDVDLAEEVLQVYEGDRPLWGTMVSTGSTNQGVRFQTPRGRFRVWLKAPLATMDSDGKKDVVPYRYEEVPWVQYFRGGVALHGAYWHHRFGHPLTHGCVNMPPADARRLYELTQATSATAPGTLVRVR